MKHQLLPFLSANEPQRLLSSKIYFFILSVFHPSPETGEEGREEEKSEGKNDNNNNAETDNMNTTKSTTQAR